MMGFPVCTTVPQASSAPTTATHVLPLDSAGAPTHVNVKTTDHLEPSCRRHSVAGWVGSVRYILSKIAKG